MFGHFVDILEPLHYIFWLRNSAAHERKNHVFPQLVHDAFVQAVLGKALRRATRETGEETSLSLN